ncbi:hypothetical protein ABMA27_002291 [Loxostege sticticalis]|uniref:Arrestin C-terminal-like domain-containing protein n=1 Tax=Loxostege sticticalis TaxID=481309 RepID=A0ABR3HXE8_LOXSC
MGIFCETVIETPHSGVFVPGSPVTGFIRYAIPENISVERIVISLKGTGRTRIDREKRMSSHNEKVYVNAASFVEIDKNAKKYSNEHKFEAHFSFDLPNNIPSSMKFHEPTGSEKMTCHIYYVVRIEFVTSGLMTFNKEFEKEITVVSTDITPKLPVKPMIYGERRKVFQPFRRGKSFVKVKAIVQNSVIRPGGKLEIAYEVDNNTSLDIKSVDARIIETFKCFDSKGNLELERGRKIKELTFKTGASKGDGSFKNSLEIDLLPELHNIENATILERCYYCILTTVLPKFHFNVHVIIPVQIGNWLETGNVLEEESPFPLSGAFHHDLPPSYWQSLEDLDSSNLNEDSNVKVDYNDDTDEENSSKNAYDLPSTSKENN